MASKGLREKKKWTPTQLSYIVLADVYLDRSPSSGKEEVFFSPNSLMVGPHKVYNTDGDEYVVNVQHKTKFDPSEYKDVGDAIITPQANCLTN